MLQAQWAGLIHITTFIAYAHKKTGEQNLTSFGVQSVMAVGFLLLRCWVGLVGVIAVVNALQCYWDPQYTSTRIYTLDPKQGSWL